MAAAFYKLVQGQILQGINPGITRPCVAACQVIKGSITLLHPSPSLPPFLPISRKNFPTMPDFYRLSRKQIILSLKRTILFYSRYIYIYRSEFDSNFHFQENELLFVRIEGSVAWKIRGNFAKGVSWKERKEIGWGGIDRGPLEALSRRPDTRAPRGALCHWRLASGDNGNPIFRNNICLEDRRLTPSPSLSLSRRVPCDGKIREGWWVLTRDEGNSITFDVSSRMKVLSKEIEDRAESFIL